MKDFIRVASWFVFWFLFAATFYFAIVGTARAGALTSKVIGHTTIDSCPTVILFLLGLFLFISGSIAICKGYDRIGERGLGGFIYFGGFLAASAGSFIGGFALLKIVE